jgi:uncharacterized protein with FMN-binding domain
MFKYKSSPMVIIILLVFSVIFFFIFFKVSKKELQENERLMKNNIVFEGVVTNTKVSGNHAFGIIELKLSQSNTTEFNKKINDGIYPYKIKGNVAEIYCTVSIERKKGDTVKVVSNEETVYYNYKNSKEVGDIYIVTDSNNIEFVNKNTFF